MKKYHQKIRGKLSESFIQEIDFNITRKEDDKVLFLDFSGFTIPVGSKFNYLIIENEKYSIQATLTFVTQQYNMPFYEISKGSKTIGVFEMAQHYACFELIPFTEDWYGMSLKCEIGFEE